VEEFEDVVFVAVVMRGESTHPEPAIKTKCANSSRPQPEVQSHRACWMVQLRVFGDFQTAPIAVILTFAATIGSTQVGSE